uniref:DNA repair protein complementing XP-A cells homolog n=1 Tax=Hirondellea gigas TaxID=1518452 RepID=A0A6A7FYS2_9CRUS
MRMASTIKKTSMFDDSDSENEVESTIPPFPLNLPSKRINCSSKDHVSNHTEDISPPKKSKLNILSNGNTHKDDANKLNTLSTNSAKHSGNNEGSSKNNYSSAKSNDINGDSSASINNTNDEGRESSSAEIKLTAVQRARIEHNRQQALLIRRERMNKIMPPIKKSEQREKEGRKVVRINDTKLIDTGGGFFIEEDEELDKTSEADMIAALQKAEKPAPLEPQDRPRCLDCGNCFDSSYLLQKFDHHVCDDCRDNDAKHSLLTKTDARNEYLLKDVDLDLRKPPLRYIVRKNPHNERWGDMKLYLKLQIEKRCLEVWGSEEAMEEAIVKKEQQREVTKKKKFQKKIMELRMNVRSSLYTRASKRHEHEYGPEEYIAEDDEYSQTCATCGHSYRYDKI